MLQEGLEELLCLYKKHNSSKILKKCALGFLLYLGLKTMKPWVKMASWTESENWFYTNLDWTSMDWTGAKMLFFNIIFLGILFL